MDYDPLPYTYIQCHTMKAADTEVYNALACPIYVYRYIVCREWCVFFTLNVLPMYVWPGWGVIPFTWFRWGLKAVYVVHYLVLQMHCKRLSTVFVCTYRWGAVDCGCHLVSLACIIKLYGFSVIGLCDKIRAPLLSCTAIFLCLNVVSACSGILCLH